MPAKSLLTVSNHLRAEATELLKATGIQGRLEQFGHVTPIGSYVYKVMVARDIDFHVIVAELTPKLASVFFSDLVQAGQFESIIFHDKHAFNSEAAARYASKKALDSYYFGLRCEFNSHEWQIGVNFITQPQLAALEITKLFDQANDDQRAQILELKTLMQRSGRKVSSAYIYRAVLEHDIHTEAKLFAYLETIGYKFLDCKPVQT